MRFEKVSDAKRYLQQIYWIDKRIKTKLEQSADLREMATKITSSMTPDKVFVSGAESKVESCMVKVVDLESSIEKDVANLMDRRREAQNYIEQMDNEREKLVLELRYLSLWSWQKIMREIHMEEAQSYRIHNDALRHFKDKVS